MGSRSRVISFEELDQRDITYFLPPGGVHNQVFAGNWIQLADLEEPDVARYRDGSRTPISLATSQHPAGAATG
jgi:hypothetical protein